MLDKIVASERQSFNANVRNGTYAQNFKENVVVVEAKTMDVTLNGYRLNNPFGKPANDIVITLYLSVVGDALVQTIKQTIGNVLSYGRIMFHTAPLVLQAAVRELPHATSDFLIMDMSGETTDIIISKKDSIVETVTMPIGTMFFVRKVSKLMNVSPQLALSYLRMAAQEKLDDAMYAKVCGHMKNVSKEWVSLFHDALRQASAEVLIPRTIFLVTEADFATILADVLSGDELEQLILSGEKFRIETLDADDVRDFYGHHAPLIRDPLRILESYFINKLKSL
jgi:cell division ATPase FtsA